MVRGSARASNGRSRARARGFTYATVLVLIIIMGIMAGVAQERTWRAMRAERETELIFRGEAYVHAIQSYRLANGYYPRELQDLVRDPSSPTRRHLRVLYPDPFAAKDKGGGWQLVRAADGGIQGVASASEQEPLKKGNFPKRWKDFEQAKTYRDWVFMYVPRAPGVPLAPGGAPPPTVTPAPTLPPAKPPT